ncbi:Heavy metal-associated isoprenylated plant protein [Thalictrum thalictroides]|uniref:Heavy metal-associated isoprenylated plant protein n=1 Tax=Thalictrum thalictroides TaxID=46969 RepID=A0A7J6WRA3_THATH|nr:Heavy metal-associated isoprenylated plant protein [Thalictrum thalictroides]
MGKEEGGYEIVTALYKLNLHCLQCARQVKKPLMRTQGVHSVDYDIKKGEIKVIGKIDGKKIHQQIEKISKRKVEMTIVDKKELVSTTTTLKLHMHCARCEYDLKKTILKLKGVHGVKSDLKSQTLVIEGTVEPPKLVKYIYKKVRKHAEIIVKKPEEKKPAVMKEVDVKFVETTKITDKGEEKKIEVKFKETTNPYFIHYVYAPQLFSDENPNACSIM